MNAQPIRQALVLVGGKGTRLGELTQATPKPLLPIGDKAVFLDILIGQLARQGFDDIVLLAGHLGDVVRAKYDGRSFAGARLSVVIEPHPLGTAGALTAARERAAPRFLLLNGDSFFDIDLRALCTASEDTSAEVMLALRRVENASRYGSVVLEGDRIVRFVEKAAAAGPSLINAGISVVRKTVLDRIGQAPCSMETDIFPALVRERRLYGRAYDGYFIDIGVAESLNQARRELAARVPPAR